MKTELQREIDRLLLGAAMGDESTSIVEYAVTCRGTAVDFFSSCAEVLLAYDQGVVAHGAQDQAALRRALPKWFQDACAPDRTPAQARTFRAWWDGLSLAEKDVEAQRSRPWSLGAWFHSMDPERREWFWWQGISNPDPGQATLEIDVLGHPYADGALQWLVMCSGGTEVVDLTEQDDPNPTEHLVKGDV